jgi:hypothetical protein
MRRPRRLGSRDELLLARDAPYDSQLVIDATQLLRLNEMVYRLDHSGYHFAGRPIEEELDEFVADQIGERLISSSFSVSVKGSSLRSMID